MEIGAQLYSLRDYCKSPADIKETLKKVAGIGYTTVQISGIGQINWGELRNYCDQFGLKAVVTHVPPEKLLEHTDLIIAEHKMLGCVNIGIGSMPMKYCGSLDGLKAFVRDFAPVMKKISDSKMRFTYHNHAGEFEKFNGKTLFDRLIEQTAKYDMNFTLDTYWTHFGGKDVVEQIEALEGRIQVIHFKDLAIVKEEPRFAAIGNGNLNFVKIIAACKKTGIKHIQVEQDQFYGADPFEEMAVSYQYLKEII